MATYVKYRHATTTGRQLNSDGSPIMQKGQKAKTKMVAHNTERATQVRKTRGCYKAASATNQMNPGEILDREAFCKRFGTTRQQIAKWEEMGLVVRQLGKRRFIRAEDFSAFLATCDTSVSST